MSSNGSVSSNNSFANHHRRRKSYFECTRQHQNRYKNILLSQSDELLTFAEIIGLKVDEIRLSPKNRNPYVHHRTKVIVNQKISQDFKFFKWMEAKDLTNISREKYCELSKTLKSLNFGKIPGYQSVLKMQHHLNNFFDLKPTDQGYYVNPEQKITFVCKQFLAHNQEFYKNEFRIKLAADSTTISKKNVKLLNFTISLIDDPNAMSVNGTFILGKTFIFSIWLYLYIDII